MIEKNDSSLRAFTLVEVMVSMTVLVLLIVLIAQILSQASATITRSTKQMDVASQAGTALDRIGSTLGSIKIAQGVVPVVYKNTPNETGKKSGITNDGFAFLSNGRTRNRASVTAPFIRMSMMGYRVTSEKESLMNNAEVPMLSWGDGTISFSTASGNVQTSSQAKSSLMTAIQTVAKDLETGNQNMVNFQTLGSGIFRFEVCFLLDDGTVVSTPPRDVNFPAATNPTLTGDAYAVAVSSETSADVNKRYVKAFIVGLAGLDLRSRELVGTNGVNLYKLSEDFPDPATINQTPLQAWDFTSDTTAAKALRSKISNYPPPILQNLRVYQRYFYLNSVQ